MFTVCGSLFVALSPAALQAVQVPEAELVPNIVRDGAPYVRDVILDTVNLTPESIQVEALEPPPSVWHRAYEMAVDRADASRVTVLVDAGKEPECVVSAVAAATVPSLHGKLLLRVESTNDTHLLFPRLPL
jgi:hypothetical protein